MFNKLTTQHLQMYLIWKFLNQKIEGVVKEEENLELYLAYPTSGPSGIQCNRLDDQKILCLETKKRKRG